MKQIVIFAVALVLIAGTVFLFKGSGKGLGAPISSNPSLGSNTSSTVGSIVTTIFSRKSGAQYRAISNFGAKDIYVSATTTNFVAGTGLLIRSSSTVILSGDSLIDGPLYAVTAVAGTTTLSLLEL